MGIPLNHGVEHRDELLKVAADHARDINALCADVATVIFPLALAPPSEAIIAAVSTRLRQIILDIEAAILPVETDERLSTWPILARSGFLREPDLIDFILARVAEDSLEVIVQNGDAQLLTSLLDHPNDNISDAAQTLLAADSLHRHAAGNSHHSLSAELFHKLCWRVAAAHEINHGVRQPDVMAAVRAAIGEYSEANRAQSAAAKIVHFSSEAERSEFLMLATAGVHLHVAALSARLGLDQDHVVRLIAAATSGPYAVMLAAAGISKIDAIEAIYLVRGGSLTAREAGIFDSGFAALNPEIAAAELAKWASARTNYLAFGQP
jgi:hypothetical protein